ncbi:MAG: hypothetical protein KFB96_09465 [Thiocapsa sp.]|uniref:hypothetical protein n=1 Tax=Thiocapsa sp. TaxID=2024551 RepID=UPI001BCD26A3|nr:hypothetical protein [Thiocapsa sp.]QVL50616.1 MAG: hypothetical protein KFB96_09465 [Thiocapsa sp.]
MKVDIILSKRGGSYMAQVSSLPEIRVKEATREAALRGVERRLRAYLDRVELVRLDIGASSDGRSLLEHFGSFADDPTFDDFQEEIAAYRQVQNRPPE